MITTLVHIYNLLFDAPLAIHPKKIDAILGAIGSRLGYEATEEQLLAAASSSKAPNKQYAVQDGIAIIPIVGSLMKRSYGLLAASGSASYEGIAAQYMDALNNPSVQGILLDIDSPGGTVSGLFELCDTLKKANATKPVYASANDSAYSAAYAICSCADRVFVSRTGGVGSIGVVMPHVDQSKADEQAGLKYTLLHAGAKKVDGNPHEPLSESAQADAEKEINRVYGMFVNLVSANRGASTETITKTEAGTFHGENAVPLLADEVGTFEDAFNALKDKLEGSATIPNIGKNAALNNSSAEENEMKKLATPSIDELIAKHATTEEAATTDEIKAAKECDEDMDSEDGDDGDDDDDQDDPKKKNDDGDAKKAARYEATRIVNLCALANMPALAADFLNEGFTVAQVEKALLKHRATKSKEVKIASSNVKPAMDFGATANQIRKDKTIQNKADAYRAYVVANSAAYEEFRSAELARNGA